MHPGICMAPVWLWWCPSEVWDHCLFSLKMFLWTTDSWSPCPFDENVWSRLVLICFLLLWCALSSSVCCFQGVAGPEVTEELMGEATAWKNSTHAKEAHAPSRSTNVDRNPMQLAFHCAANTANLLPHMHAPSWHQQWHRKDTIQTKSLLMFCTNPSVLRGTT